MATVQRNTSAQSPQDFIRIQDLFYLCLGKWHWFVISLVVCLGVAVWYLLTTPPVYTRSASILIKDDSKGKTASTDMETFADFGLFTSNTNVNNEMGTLQSPDLMREVVSCLHLDMDYKVPGRYHRQTVYGETLPINVVINGLADDESATFTLQLSKDGKVTLSDMERNGESISDKDLKGNMDDTIQSGIGKVIVSPTSFYKKGTEALIYVSRMPLGAATAAYTSGLSVSQNDEKSNIISLSLKNESLYKMSQLYSLHGQNKDALAKTKLGAWEYDIIGPWYKCNMTDIMAGIGLAQLRRYPDLLERRKQIIERYDCALRDCNVKLLNHYDAEHTSSGHGAV